MKDRLWVQTKVFQCKKIKTFNIQFRYSTYLKKLITQKVTDEHKFVKILHLFITLPVRLSSATSSGLIYMPLLTWSCKDNLQFAWIHEDLEEGVLSINHLNSLQLKSLSTQCLTENFKPPVKSFMFNFLSYGCF